MKLLSFIPFLVLAVLSLAQNVVISYPPQGQLIVPGEDFTVQISRPNSLTGSTEVSVAIAVASCANTPCRTPDQVLGDVVYKGPYTPFLYSNIIPEYQNFTVSIPSGFPAGPAQLNVAHFSLVGVRRCSFSHSFRCGTK
ncbi:hypothetical protein AX14_012781 [Amanita brunnescens Koide BX004]|nr:hypothetical protein AX14_012781 [Amanita brunnescens Koide BX004]